MPTAVESINLKSYDLIISSSWALCTVLKEIKIPNMLPMFTAPDGHGWVEENIYQDQEFKVTIQQENN